MPLNFSEVGLNSISRREFLKLAGASLLSLFWMPLFKHAKEESGQGLGRIVSNETEVYTRATPKAQPVSLLFKDQVFPINSVIISEDGPSHNPIWYQLGNQGYVHSGNVHPVDVSINEPVTYIPPQGALFEVTVPFSDTLWLTRLPKLIAYRLYYSTTHWVKSVFRDDAGNYWYEIIDDKWGFTHFANASHLRQLKLSDVAPLSPQVPIHQKRLEIRLSSQTVVAYENDWPVYMVRTATGAKFSNGDYRTPIGHFITSRKRPSRHMAAGDPAAANGYDLPGIPWVCYLTESGISFHGTYWHNDFGKPRSHGCINLSSQAARWVYRWTSPVVPLEDDYLAHDTGTSVDIIE